MPVPLPENVIKFERAGGVAVVRLTPRTSLDEDKVRAIGERLYALVGQAQPPKILVCFGAGTQLTSSMLGKLIALHKRAEAAGGRLALCTSDPVLLDLFKTSHLDDFFSVHGDEQSALQFLS